MTAGQVIMIIVFFIASGYLLYRMRPLYEAVTGEVGPRTRRLLISRGFVATGLWQWSIAGFLLAQGSWVNTIALIGAGGFMLAAARLARSGLWPGF